MSEEETLMGKDQDQHWELTEEDWDRLGKETSSAYTCAWGCSGGGDILIRVFPDSRSN